MPARRHPGPEVDTLPHPSEWSYDVHSGACCTACGRRYPVPPVRRAGLCGTSSALPCHSSGFQHSRRRAASAHPSACFVESTLLPIPGPRRRLYVYYRALFRGMELPGGRPPWIRVSRRDGGGPTRQSSRLHCSSARSPRVIVWQFGLFRRASRGPNSAAPAKAEPRSTFPHRWRLWAQLLGCPTYRRLGCSVVGRRCRPFHPRYRDGRRYMPGSVLEQHCRVIRLPGGAPPGATRLAALIGL